MALNIFMLYCYEKRKCYTTYIRKLRLSYLIICCVVCNVQIQLQHLICKRYNARNLIIQINLLLCKEIIYTLCQQIRICIVCMSTSDCDMESEIFNMLKDSRKVENISQSSKFSRKMLFKVFFVSGKSYTRRPCESNMRQTSSCIRTQH